MNVIGVDICSGDVIVTPDGVTRVVCAFSLGKIRRKKIRFVLARSSSSDTFPLSFDVNKVRRAQKEETLELLSADNLLMNRIGFSKDVFMYAKMNGWVE